MKRKKKRERPPVFRLAPLLRLRRMTRRELSLAAKLPVSMVYRLAAGRANPSWATILKLTRALGCSAGDFEQRGKA